MGSRALFRQVTVVTLLLASCLLGCSGPSHKPQEFVGDWTLESKPQEIVLTLKADGTGMSRFMYYPSVQSINWVLVGNQLVVNATDGSVSDKYTYTFSGPDKMILTKGGNTFPLVKAK